MVPLKLALWTVLSMALLISVVTDVRRRRILDAVTYPALAALLALRLWLGGVGDVDHGLVCGLVGALGAAVLFLPAALRGKLGFGDVKLLAVVGAAFGYPVAFAAAVFVTLVGALQALALLAWHGEILKTARHGAARLMAKLRLAQAPEANAERHIPYAVAIALGSFLTMWWQGSGAGG